MSEAAAATAAPRRLWELAGAEPERRFSPYCWRIRMALAHKGLDYEGVPWRFTEKDRIAFSGQGLVPVLEDGGRVVHDSWAIAEYLEATYADRPSLFGGGEEAKRAVRFTVAWTDWTLHAALIRLNLADIFAHVHPKDRDYFRSSREQRFGTTLEAMCDDREGRLAQLRQVLAPVRALVKSDPYLGGAEPSFADYAVFGAFMWCRSVSPIRLLEPDDPVHAWRERLLDRFDGMARRATGYPC